MRNKTIAIWAPLRYANYGDDLQAIVFALYLESLGYDVKVFQLDEELSMLYNLEIAPTVDDLCNNVSLCIIAGGGLLTPRLLPKRILSSVHYQYEHDFKDLCGAIRKYNTKFCAISIGGDGKTRNPFMYYSKHRINFFKSPNFLNGTVRLEGDAEQMKKFGKSFKYIPDCLLQTPKYLTLNLDKSIPPSRPIRIGFNFKTGKYLDTVFIRDAFEYASKNNNIELYFVKTHMEKTGINYEYIPDKETDTIKIVQYESPTQLMEFMSSIDVLVTSKLHLGITGLTIGTPYLSYRGPGKARAFTETIGGAWAVVDDHVSFAFLLNTFFKKSKTELFNSYNIELLNDMIDRSNEQFLFCKSIVERYG